MCERRGSLSPPARFELLERSASLDLIDCGHKLAHIELEVLLGVRLFAQLLEPRARRLGRVPLVKAWPSAPPLGLADNGGLGSGDIRLDVQFCVHVFTYLVILF